MPSALSLLSIWLRGTCTVSGARANAIAKAFEAEDAGRDWHMLFGAGLTRTGRACLVHGYGGELFVFALTRGQAGSVNALGSTMTFTLDGKCLTAEAGSPLELEEVEFDSAASQPMTAPISGRCLCLVDAPWVGSACLQLEIVLRREQSPQETRRHSLFFYPAPLLEGEATIEFAFPPVSAADNPDPPAAGQTVATLLRFCRPPDPARGTDEVPLSNALGSLLTFI